MDRTRGHYAKWNKSDQERKILYHFIHMKPKKTSTQTWCRIRPVNREQTDGWQKEVLWQYGQNGKGDWEIQPSNYGKSKYRNKRHSIGNIVNYTLIVLHGD